MRVTPVFTDPVYQNDSVYRCLQHEGPDKNPHILTFKKENVKYEGSKEERLSAVISLTSMATAVHKKIFFLFNCQNSCNSGIKRRQTALVFSLEDGT